MNQQTYLNITPVVAADFYAKAIASGFTPDGPQPTDFNGLVSFGIKDKGVDFYITYSAEGQHALVSIVKKDFPYNLVPDDVIFSQIDGYLKQAQAGKLEANMSIWSNLRHENEVKWGGIAKPYFHRRHKHDADGRFHFNISEVSILFIPSVAIIPPIKALSICPLED